MKSDPWQTLTRRYALTLRQYQANQHEAVLAAAYELGRQAIARGAGVLDMVRIHHQALEGSPAPVPDGTAPSLQAANNFFLESLSPFEVTHRGFRETNAQLQHVIATLETRNRQLSQSNRALHREIGERKRTEKAQRESERRLRKLFLQARAMEENLRSLSDQLLHAQEEERKRISRELHDEVGQALMFVSVTLGTLKQSWAADPARVDQKLADAQRLLVTTMETVHGFARELRPAMLDELGLAAALRSYLKSLATRTGLSIQFHSDPLVDSLSSDLKTVLYRVAQESLTNVARHARARRVAVTLRRTRHGICMKVADDGKSFRGDPETSSRSRKRLGLLGMRERVRLVNGKFAILPRPGKGTTVRVEIPFKRQPGPRVLKIRPEPGAARAAPAQAPAWASAQAA